MLEHLPQRDVDRCRMDLHGSAIDLRLSEISCSTSRLDNFGKHLLLLIGCLETYHA